MMSEKFGCRGTVCGNASKKMTPLCKKKNEEYKFGEFGGITLISLVITIIILIILAGVAINLSLGKNGIFTKAKQATEKYTEEEIKEKVNIGIADIIIKEVGLGNDVTINNMLQGLIENKTFESIDKEENSGSIGDYEVKLKQDENGNIVIDKIEKTAGMRMTYTLDPVSYTNKEKVIVTFIVEEKEKGIKSVTKPDGLVIYPRNGKVAVDYEVDKNGSYQFIVENGEGTKIKKNVIVDTIDRLAPKDFKITAVGSVTKIKVTAVTQDSESDGINVKSGMNKYEYYVKKSTAKNYTKSESNEIKGFYEGGTYSVYAVAYDKAGNKTQSETINIEVQSAIFLNTNNYFGYPATGSMTGWSVVGSSSTGRLETYTYNKKCYTVTNYKVDITELQKLIFTCTSVHVYSRESTRFIFGLVNDPASNDFVVSVTRPKNLGDGSLELILDTSLIQGNYYIKILIDDPECNPIVYGSYMQGGAKVYGE